MQIEIVTPQMLEEAVVSLSKQLKEIKEAVAIATVPPLYADLKSITKMFGYSSSQRMKLFIDTALEAGHKIRMIKPKASRYDTSARVHYHIGDIEKAFAYAQ
ncbi:MAG: hypothetical protein E7079_08210 [Bacteroidales bacterium]|nr:hypothetical protein [Bacteroidales bacterium]